MTTLSQSLPEIGIELPGGIHGHAEAHDDASLGSLSADIRQMGPADEPDIELADIDCGAGHEQAGDGREFGQWWLGNFLSHSSSPSELSYSQRIAAANAFNRNPKAGPMEISARLALPYDLIREHLVSIAAEARLQLARAEA